MSDRTRAVQIDIRCEGDQAAQAEALVRALRSDGPGPEDVPVDGDDEVRLVIGPDDEAAMLEAVQDGAMGYVVVTESVEELRRAAAAVARGEAVIPPMMLGALLRHTVRQQRAMAATESRLEILTAREREVIDLVAEGRNRRDIASRLSISPATVRTHVHRSMVKLSVHSQNELMALLAPLNRGDE